MSDRVFIDRDCREFSIGSSFFPSSGISFHTLRYDFKPASIDVNKTAALQVGDNNEVSVIVPNVESTGKSNHHTVFKGSKRKSPKDCVFIIEKNGNVTLERLSQSINLKKTRTDKSGQLNLPLQSNASLDKAKISPVHKVMPGVQSSSVLKNEPKHTSHKKTKIQSSPNYNSINTSPQSKKSISTKQQSGFHKNINCSSSSKFSSANIKEESSRTSAVTYMSESSTDSSNSYSVNSDSTNDSMLINKQMAPNMKALSMPTQLLTEDLQLSEDSD